MEGLLSMGPTPSNFTKKRGLTKNLIFIKKKFSPNTSFLKVRKTFFHKITCFYKKNMFSPRYTYAPKIHVFTKKMFFSHTKNTHIFSHKKHVEVWE